MQADALSQTFAALADPTRRAILKRLAAGPANVKELSRPFDMSGPAVCKHLRVLERAGLVRHQRAKCSALVHASKTSSGGAAYSRSSIRSALAATRMAPSGAWSRWTASTLV